MISEYFEPFYSPVIFFDQSFNTFELPCNYFHILLQDISYNVYI